MAKPIDPEKHGPADADLVPARTARERIAQGIVVFGSACMAVGGVVGYALGFLEAMRQRRVDYEN